MNSAIEVLSCPSMAATIKCHKWKQTLPKGQARAVLRNLHQGHVVRSYGSYPRQPKIPQLPHLTWPISHRWIPGVKFAPSNDMQTTTSDLHTQGLWSTKPDWITSHQFHTPGHHDHGKGHKHPQWSSFPHIWPPWPRQGPQTSTINLNRMPQCPLQSRFCPGIIHKVCNSLQSVHNKRNELKL